MENKEPVNTDIITMDDKRDYCWKKSKEDFKTIVVEGCETIFGDGRLEGSDDTKIGFLRWTDHDTFIRSPEDLSTSPIVSRPRVLLGYLFSDDHRSYIVALEFVHCVRCTNLSNVHMCIENSTGETLVLHKVIYTESHELDEVKVYYEYAFLLVTHEQMEFLARATKATVFFDDIQIHGYISYRANFEYKKVKYFSLQTSDEETDEILNELYDFYQRLEKLEAEKKKESDGEKVNWLSSRLGAFLLIACFACGTYLNVFYIAAGIMAAIDVIFVLLPNSKKSKVAKTLRTIGTIGAAIFWAYVEFIYY